MQHDTGEGCKGHSFAPLALMPAIWAALKSAYDLKPPLTLHTCSWPARRSWRHAR